MSDENAQHPEWLHGGGETGALLRSIDWAKTPVGPVHGWPQSLRTTLSICLSSRFPIVLFWGHDLVLLYNDGYRAILGAKHPSAMGQRGLEVWTEIRQVIEPMLRQVMTTGEATWSEDLLLALARDGAPEESYFTFTYSPIREESGGVGGIFCAVMETTDKVIEERRLRLLNALAEVTQAKTTGEACADAAERLKPFTRDLPFALLYLLDDASGDAKLAGSANIEPGTRLAPTFIRSVDRSIWPFDETGTKGPSFVELLVEGPAGARGAVVLSIARSGGGRPFGFLVAGLSPLLRKSASYDRFHNLLSAAIAQAVNNAATYQHEKRRAEELAQLDRAKTAFFSNVSHEFRTPLTLMLGPTEDALSSPERALLGPALETVHRNGLRLLKLVNTLLDFSRIEAGRAHVSYELTDLSALTADLASSFRSAMDRAGLSFEVDCPPLSELICVDRDKWEKIVLNLLSNAIKFTFDGGIRVGLYALDGHVELTVRDTGVGIAESELPRLFERFHRIEGTRARTHEGSGIGLALVQDLVRMHGGTIEVLSKLGEGTTFYVRIPKGTAHLPADRLRTVESDPPRVANPKIYAEEALRWVQETSDSVPPSVSVPMPDGHSRERILVADDNPDMRNYVARLLRERWLVETVANGREALAAVRRHPPDLVLSDVMMPEMDGFGLLRAIRSDAALKAIPVLLLSARAGAESAAEGLEAGADDYLVKPFAARDLLVRVAARLATAKAARDAALQRQSLYGAFMQAPFTFSIMRGPELVVEFANDTMLKAWGKGPDVVGLPLIEALPEIQGQPFVDLLLGVLRSGVSHEGREEHAKLPTGPGGAIEDVFYNYVYAPVPDARGTVDGVFVAGFNVTEQVTSRRHLEALAAELRVTSERLQAAQTAGRIGIFDWDITGGGMHWSPELYLLMGLEPGVPEASPDAWTDRLHVEDRERGWVAFRQAIDARKDHFDVEVRLRQGDDSARWVRLSSAIRYDEAGQAVRLLGAAVDVEALRRAATDRDAALRAKEAQWKMVARLFNEAPAPIALMRGPELVIELVNPRCVAMWNRDSADGLVGKPVLEALPELQGQGFEALLAGVMATGEPFVGHEMPIGIRLPDGQVAPRYFNFVYAPITNGLGVVDGVSAIAFDATDAVLTRREFDRAKDVAAAEFRTLVDNVPELAWTARPDGYIDFYNHRWYEYTGTTFAEMDGWGWSKVHDPQMLPMVSERWHRSLATGERFEMEFPLRRHDGRFRWFLTRVSPLRDENGRIVRWFGSNTDIHELRETRERSAALLHELETSSRTKDEFLATMSHELRTPLNAMLGWARMLKSVPRGSLKMEHGLSVIERNAQAQARLVDDLLDVSRIISGKLRLRMQRTSVAAVVSAAVDVVRSAAESKNVHLSVNIEPDVGATIADPDRLQQIVWNLLTNAIRFTPDQGRVTVGAHSVGSSLILRVEDTGAGIPPEHLPHIFERFRQVDSSTTRAHGGLGLGLAIVRHLAEAHGGTVGVSSDGPGRGSVFTVTLPIRAVSTSDVDSEEEAEEAEEAEEVTNGALPEEIKSVRTLVVEDDPDSLELIRIVLEGAGAKVTTATSAREALNAPGPFDIIISDIGMPEMDGYTFLRRIRSRDEGATVPALALTAYASGDDAGRALRAGYQEHLSKPVDSSRLIEAVKTWAQVRLGAR